jgi:two-component system, chemotaxis family, chemotaxis protein CheY
MKQTSSSEGAGLVDHALELANKFREEVGFQEKDGGSWVWKNKRPSSASPSPGSMLKELIRKGFHMVTTIKKILIVDDSPVARRIVKSCIFRAEDYEFFEADDGVMALETFTSWRPDVIFMDVNMPNMSGIECLEKIKKVDSNAIVIICSSETNPESLSKLKSLGAFTVVKKPPTKESIQLAISQAKEAIK